MTTYAFDPDQNSVTRHWETGIGLQSGILCRLPDKTGVNLAYSLASALTRLSREMWNSYVTPVSAADFLDDIDDGESCGVERQAFTAVVDALRNPHLPSGGLLLQSYVQVEEAAHAVGRTLHAIDDPTLTDQVVADVSEEMQAIDEAERGVLEGRARQAVALTRIEASPLQVLAADEVLAANPLAPERLFEEVDATAASMAAAHWLLAAAEVAAEAAGIGPSEVIMEADNIEALPVGTSTYMLEQMETGIRPQDVVSGMLREAMTVGEGRIPDPQSLVREIESAWLRAQRYGAGDQELVDDLMPRLSRLDPQRPALDLLEDLLAGIRGAYLLYEEYSDVPYGASDDDDLSDEELDAWVESVSREFCEQVRQNANAHRDRIL